MQVEVSDYWDAASHLCQHSWCPACSGDVEPELLCGELRTLVCFCQDCGHVLLFYQDECGDLVLVRPNDEQWRNLIASPMGPLVLEIRRTLALQETCGAVHVDVPRPPVELHPIAWFVLGVFALAVFLGFWV